MTDPTLHTAANYHWEFHRWTNAWAFQLGDARGAGRSDQAPEVFARNIARIYNPGDAEPWRLVVWDGPGVGRPPVYTITSEQERERQ